MQRNKKKLKEMYLYSANKRTEHRIADIPIENKNEITFTYENAFDFECFINSIAKICSNFNVLNIEIRRTIPNHKA